MSLSQWSLLALLSMLWGGSFLFVGIAVREVDPLVLVALRVGLAAAILVPIVLAVGHTLPRLPAAWGPFVVMALLNNVVPFTAITLGQRDIPSGLASVLNATTPLFAVTLTHLLTTDRMRGHHLAGVLIGILGVAVLTGPAAIAAGLRQSAEGSILGMAFVLIGACSYGFASVWGRRLRETPPLVSAACQLTASTVIMLPLAVLAAAQLPTALPTTQTIVAVLGLASLSTALAYAVFFRILTVSGPTNVMLVTLLIPVSAILLGMQFLGERLALHQFLGAGIVALSLIVIDGRLLGRIKAA